MKNKLVIGSVLAVLIIIFAGYVFFYNKTLSSGLYKKSIKSIKLDYYAVDNIIPSETLDIIASDGYIKSNQIVLEGENYNKVLEYLKNLKEDKSYNNSISDEYKLLLNDEYQIVFDKNYGKAGYINNKKIIVGIDNGLFELISNIIMENNNRLLQSLKTVNMSIEKEDKNVSIKDNNDINNILNSIKYINVNIDKDYLEYDNIYSIITLDNDVKLYLYENNNIGYILDSDNSSFIYIEYTKYLEYEKLEDLINNVYDNNKENVVVNNNETKNTLTDNFTLTGGLKENEVCSTAIEPLIINGKQLCYFSCEISDLFTVEMSDGSKYGVKEALEKGIVTIEKLKEKGLPCK